ncbi:MAG: protein kinase [Candidatus Aminicenantes bacterium]
MTIECPQCRSDNPDTSSYCADCGTPLVPSKDIPAPTKTLEKPFPQFVPGTSLSGRYEIIRELGKGGMGEVYLAEDTNLKRQVAVKVLPQPFALDKERLARFEREARLLASLNHPNIATIHGLEKSDGQQFLVMELIKGDTLAERLKKGPLPVEGALEICRQIAEGLESAHEKGVVHRDLKPGNIKITPEGMVKILDFGLAKAFHEESEEVDLSRSPTLTDQMTQPGVILGTAAYMSPEQTKGKAVGKQADIWAFGCILYECLTARRAFSGDTVSESVAAILKGEPEREALPADLTPSVRTLLRRCLQKDPHMRLHDIADVRIELDEAITLPAEEVAVAKRLSMGWILSTGAAALLVGVLLGFILWKLPRSVPSPAPVASVIKVEPGHSLHGFRFPLTLDRPSRTAMAISRDGRFVVYDAVKDDAGPKAKSQLFIRRLDLLKAEPIPGTEGGISPFLSPDERWIGFLTIDKLKKVPIEGGVAQDLCDVPAFGVCWDDNNMIIFSRGNSTGLSRVSAAGGEPEELTKTDPEIGEFSHRLPFALPQGKGVLFTIMRSYYDLEPRVAILENETREWRILLEDASDARYVPTGHIVFLRKGDLMAVAFDLDKLVVFGEPVRIVTDVIHMLNVTESVLNSGAGQFCISDSGSLVYATGGIIPDKIRSLVWVDQNGVEEPIGSLTGFIVGPRLSPDGRKIVYYTMGTENKIWIYDIERDIPKGLVSDGISSNPRWTPDGRKIIFGWASLNPPNNIYWRPADGSAEKEQLTTDQNRKRLGSMSPDGEFLAFVGIQNDFDILIYSFRDGSIRPFLATDHNETYPEFSPDGRWLAYVSDESGRDEVYVRSFTAPGGEKRISHRGGRAPLWARSGKQIFYRSEFQVWAVDLRTEPEFSPSSPRLLFEKRYGGTTPVRGYDISLDGQRFLMVKPGERVSQPVTEMILIQNWFEKLKRLVPTGK